MEKRYKPELLVSKDQTREHLCAPHYEGEKRRVVACNGHALVIVPVTETQGCKGSGSWPVVEIKTERARARAHKLAELEFQSSDLVEPSQPYPPIDAVMPNHKQAHTFSISAKYLIDAIKAMGCEKDNIRVHVDVADKLAPVKVTSGYQSTSAAVAITMPLRD